MHRRSLLLTTGAASLAVAAATAVTALGGTPASTAATTAPQQDVVLASADTLVAAAAIDMEAGEPGGDSGEDARGPGIRGKHRGWGGVRHRLLTDAQREQLRTTGHLTFSKDTKHHGTVTVALQLGEVTAVSSSSVTVKSKDGYAHSYAIDDNSKVRVRRHSGAVSDLRTGVRVAVIDVVDAKGHRAVRVFARPFADRLHRHHPVKQTNAAAVTSASRRASTSSL